jgi:hypothetical protein
MRFLWTGACWNSIGSAVVSLCLIGLSEDAGASQASPGVPNRTVWCEVNPREPQQGDAVSIPKSDFGVVVAAAQRQAQQLLFGAPLVELSGSQASAFVGHVDEGRVSTEHFYLVRASAFYVDPNYAVKSHFDVYWYPMERLLYIVNTSLSQPGTSPSNVALFVWLKEGAASARTVCLTAA